MARFAASLALPLLLLAARVHSLDLDDVLDYEEAPGTEADADTDDYVESPTRQAEALLGSDIWRGGSHAVRVAKRGPLGGPGRVKARAVTPEELHTLFGDSPRRKKSVHRPKASLLRQYLTSALRRKHIAIKRKRSARKRSVVKRSGGEKPKREDQPTAPEPEEEEAKPEAVRRLMLTNALLSQENSFLTDALNEATVAQTTGNDEGTVRKEMDDIRNAERIEAIMRKLEDDQEAMKKEQQEKEDPEEVQETVVVTDNSVADLATCPVVKQLSTGCSQVVEGFGFRMDEDALDACDAHRICYGCSTAFSASRDLCDRLFIAQSQNLCLKEDDRAECASEAMTLLRAMRQVHQSTLDSADSLEKTCRSPCVNAYFRAVYRPRR